ncbi:MAG: hypothetical protein QNK36_17910, partial [Colwellia sp.]|nr:hypothetical protein [Colwellia sp.]
NHLDKVSKREVKGNKQDELVLFMLSCLYALVTASKDHSELEQKAELLNLDGFSEIKAMFFTGS